jgi:EAL domain-containing protein (putative c-di-GMP-specific phosphodiesterase class I)
VFDDFGTGYASLSYLKQFLLDGPADRGEFELFFQPQVRLADSAKVRAPGGQGPLLENVA